MKQTQCDVINTLREYERAHRVWMNTSIFQPKEIRDAVKSELDTARKAYVKAVEIHNPNWIVI